MGDETGQFASRFAEAVATLAALAGAEGSPRREIGAAEVRRALDAVEAVHRTETSAVRDWPERRARVLAGIARARDVLEREGTGAALAASARAIVELLGPEPRPPPRAAARRRRRG